MAVLGLAGPPAARAQDSSAADEYDGEYDNAYDGDDDVQTQAEDDMDSALAIEDEADEAAQPQRTFAYQFSMEGKEDPFVPSVTLAHFNLQDESTSRSIVRPKEFAVGDELQKYQLKALKVVGIWRTDETYKALITTPGSGAVIAGVGDFVGTKNGKIVHINKDRLLIREVSISTDDVRMIHHEELFLQDKKLAVAGGDLFSSSPEPNE